MQRLLVSVRGPKEAVEAAAGGAHIADVEYPASALGTPYPLNISSVRDRLRNHGFQSVAVSTNIGELQQVRSSACQSALGVAAAGADLIKFGLAEQSLQAAIYLGTNVVRTVRQLSTPQKKLFPAVFVDDDMRRFLDPFKDGPLLLEDTEADGILLDTFNKLIGKGLLDYCAIEDLRGFVETVHSLGKEAWIAGSITADEMPGLWETGVDVICVRGAACDSRSSGRFGDVRRTIVERLVATIPAGDRAPPPNQS